MQFDRLVHCIDVQTDKLTTDFQTNKLTDSQTHGLTD